MKIWKLSLYGLVIIISSGCVEQMATKPVMPSSKPQSSESVFVLKHPDFAFAPTNPNGIRVYYGFDPVLPNYSIGKIAVLLVDQEVLADHEPQLKRKAAEIGGDAVVIVDVKHELKEYGLPASVTTTMPISIGIGEMAFTYFISNTTSTLPRTISFTSLLGLVVRWTEDAEREIIRDYIKKLKEYLPLATEGDILKISHYLAQNGALTDRLEGAIKYAHVIRKFGSHPKFNNKDINTCAEVLHNEIIERSSRYPNLPLDDMINTLAVSERFADFNSALDYAILKLNKKAELLSQGVAENVADSTASLISECVVYLVEMKNIYPQADIESIAQWIDESLKTNGRYPSREEIKEMVIKSHNRKNKTQMNYDKLSVELSRMKGL